MFKLTLFKPKNTLFKIQKTICGTINFLGEQKHTSISIENNQFKKRNNESHWTDDSPFFQVQQMLAEEEKRRTDPPRDFTYKTLKGTVHVSYRSTNNEKIIPRNTR